MADQNKVRVVIIESPYDNWGNEELKQLFCKTVALKLRGYQAEHPYGVLPVDTYDFIAKHLLICEQNGQHLEPIVSFRTITQDRCITHRLPFPAIPLAKYANSQDHEKAILEILDECQRTNTQISYDSSFTIDPRIRKDRGYTNFLRELLAACMMNYHLDQEVGIPRIMGCGVPRVKTDIYFKNLGCESVTLNNKRLPLIPQASLIDELVDLLQWKAPSDYGKKLSETYMSFWKRRLTIGEEFIPQSIKTREAA